MAKKQVSEEVLRSLKQIRTLEDRILNGNLDPADVRQPLQDIIDGRALLYPFKDSHWLRVNHYSCAELVEYGRYDRVDLKTSAEYLPSEKKDFSRDVEAFLVHFKKSIDSSTAEAEMARLGLRSATLNEFLSFGMFNPNVQRLFPIISLGARWVSNDGEQCVGFLGEVHQIRILAGEEVTSNHLWHSDYRFLAVHKRFAT